MSERLSRWIFAYTSEICAFLHVDAVALKAMVSAGLLR